MTQRRTLLARLGALLMGGLGAALAAPAALFLSDPLRRRRRQGGAGEGAGGADPGAGEVPSVPLARIAEVPDLDRGERPLRQGVVARDVRDAWGRLPEVRLGSVWLFRRGSELSCLSTVCPHAGCAIDYDEKRNLFACPCHTSTFGLDGRRREGPSPRDMDSLEVEVKDGQVRCRYQRFRLAVAGKEPV